MSSNEGNMPKLCYRLKNKTKEVPIKEVDGKMKCPICQIVAKNLQLHFKKKTGCSDKINLDHFVKIHEEYRKQKDKIRDRIKKQRSKAANPESFNLARKTDNKNYRNKKKEANQEEFNLANIKAVEKSQKKKKKTI